MRPFTGISEPDLEIALLRKGVGALAAGRHCCADCGRVPLIGERVYRYERGATVCALCSPRRRSEPAGSEVVRHSERGLSVRLRPAA